MRLFKKWWFWLIVGIIIIGSIVVNEDSEPEKAQPKLVEQDEVDDEPEKDDEPEGNGETEATTEEEETDITWDDIKEQDKIVGESDQDFKELTKSKPGDVRGDVTGNWRVVTISQSVDIVEYAHSYQDLYMEEDEVHFIVNFNYNTTAWLNELGGLLYVDIRERVDKEEHDADKLGSGMVLKSYRIYPDGDIEELEIE